MGKPGIAFLLAIHIVNRYLAFQICVWEDKNKYKCMKLRLKLEWDLVNNKYIFSIETGGYTQMQIKEIKWP